MAAGVSPTPTQGQDDSMDAAIQHSFVIVEKCCSQTKALSPLVGDAKRARQTLGKVKEDCAWTHTQKFDANQAERAHRRANDTRLIEPATTHQLELGT
jgi:hypothetical protein